MLKDLEKNRSCPTVHALLVKLNLWTNYFIDPPFENSLSISASSNVLSFIQLWIFFIIGSNWLDLAKKNILKGFFFFISEIFIWFWTLKIDLESHIWPFLKDLSLSLIIKYNNFLRICLYSIILRIYLIAT